MSGNKSLGIFAVVLALIALAISGFNLYTTLQDPGSNTDPGTLLGARVYCGYNQSLNPYSEETINLTNIIYDPGNHIDLVHNCYNVSVDGIYRLTGEITLPGATGDLSVIIKLNNTITVCSETVPGSTEDTASVSEIVHLKEGNSLTLIVGFIAPDTQYFIDFDGTTNYLLVEYMSA